MRTTQKNHKCLFQIEIEAHRRQRMKLRWMRSLWLHYEAIMGSSIVSPKQFKCLRKVRRMFTDEQKSHLVQELPRWLAWVTGNRVRCRPFSEPFNSITKKIIEMDADTSQMLVVAVHEWELGGVGR